MPGTAERPRRRRQRGSQVLELVAALPLLALVATICWQVFALLQAKAEAQSDARVMARRAALCSDQRLPDPSEFDQEYHERSGDSWRFDPPGERAQGRRVTVVFTIHAPQLLGVPVPWVAAQEGRATMDREPCGGNPTS